MWDARDELKSPNTALKSRLAVLWPLKCQPRESR
jgi:hypothetical protein